MEHPRVAQVDLWALDLALCDVDVPRFELADEERVRHKVEIPSSGVMADVERVSDRGCVENAGVVVCEHRPESAGLQWRELQAKRREVAFDRRSQVVLAPLH